MPVSRMWPIGPLVSDTKLQKTGKYVNPPMAKGGGYHNPPPQQVFPIFSDMGRAFLQTKFLPVGSSLGHLPIKKFFKSDLPSWL